MVLPGPSRLRRGMPIAHSDFTPHHRGGAGAALVLLHGFTDCWRVWDLVLGTLERHHDVFAPTLPGHAGGPPVPDGAGPELMVDVLEAQLDAQGIGEPHVAGNSLGGFLALKLAERGRARSVTAFAPGGGWAAADPAFTERLIPQFEALHEQAVPLAPHADRLMATPEGRRRASSLRTVRHEHLSAELLGHLMVGLALCDVRGVHEVALHGDYAIDPERVTCPIRIVWGLEDRLLLWPDAGVRYAQEWLPHADWVLLDDVGHCPQLDVPLEAAQLILGWTGG